MMLLNSDASRLPLADGVVAYDYQASLYGEENTYLHMEV